MKKILAFAGSTSSTSINKQLATFAAISMQNTAFDVVDLRDFEMPLYSEDQEKEHGFSENAIRFSALLDQYDGFIVSLAEHNGSYAAGFKNIFDWSSRVNPIIFRNKPLLLMATSPGARGGQSVLEAAADRFPRMGAKELFQFSLPSFYEHFKEGSIIDDSLKTYLQKEVHLFENAVQAL